MSLRIIIKVFGNKKEGDHKAQDPLYFQNMRVRNHRKQKVAGANTT